MSLHKYLPFAFSLLIMASAALPAVAQSVGSRVMVSPFSMENQWFPGTVLGEDSGAIIVKLDKRPDHDNEVYKIQKKWLKPGGGTPPEDWNKISGADAVFYGVGTPEQLTQQAKANGNAVPQGAGGGVAGNTTFVSPHPANAGGYPAHNPQNDGQAPIANPHVMPKNMTRDDLERYGVQTNRNGERRYSNSPWGRQLQQLHQQEQQAKGGTTTVQPQPNAGTGGTPAAGGALGVGSRVMASPFSSEQQWFPGTIVKMLDGGKGGVIVRLDQKPGVNYQDVFQMNEKWVKPGGGAAPANQGGIDPNLVTYYGLDPALAAAPAPNHNQAPPAPNNGTPGGNQQINKNEKNVKGKGQPPDGLYEVNKIYTGGYMYLGTLEIRGNTYRGLAQEGPFHPYTMDGAGGITWTAGLQGIPDGWSVDKGNYNGHDHTGKDWIQLRFQGFRRAEEIADAIHK